MELLIGICIILFFLGLPIWAIVSARSASNRSKELKGKIDSLESDIAVLRHRIWKMETEGKPVPNIQSVKSDSGIDLELFAHVANPVATTTRTVSPISLRTIDPSTIELTSPELVPNFEELIDIPKEPIVAGEPFTLTVGGKEVVLEPVDRAPEPVDDIPSSISIEPIVDGESFTLTIGGKEVTLEPVETEPEPINVIELPPNLETAMPNRVLSGESEQFSEPLVFKRSESSKANDPEQLSPLMQWMKSIAETNVFVKIGVGLLFAGLAFFLKYAVDHQLFAIPMEVRVGAVALTGIGLTILGSRVKTRRTYGLILQGAGMAIFYLTTFAAFKLFGLIGPIPALILLVITGIVTAALAIKNDERTLALIAVVGGFSAPILAPSDNPSHVSMFSYYLLVNLAILGITALRPWWILGTVGFLFTFIISTLWGVTAYDPSKLASTEPFLVIYWGMYLFMALFYEFCQKDSVKTVPASTLLFGVPTVAFSLQILLMKETEFGVALSAIIASIVYALVFIGIRNNPKTSKALLESIRTISILFLTLAFPFALAPVHTSTAWALEGAVIVAIALRQSRKNWPVFGAVIQLGSLLFFFSSIDEIGMGSQLFLNSYSFSALMIIVALLFSSYKLRHRSEWILFTAAIILLVHGGVVQIEAFIPETVLAGALTLYGSTLSMLLFFVGTQLKWRALRNCSLGIIAVLLVSFGELFFDHVRLFTSFHGAAILISLVFWYVQLAISSRESLQKRREGIFHAWTILFLTLMLTRELWLISALTLDTASAKLATVAVIPLITLLSSLYLPVFPFTNYRVEMESIVAKPIAWLFILWSAVAFCLDGATTVRYIPLLNPLDLIQAVALFATAVVITRSGYEIKGKISFAISLFVFLWGMTMTLRTTCEIIGISYAIFAMVDSTVIQAVVTIFSALYGTAYMITGSKRGRRSYWIAGVSLLGFVAIKLVSDLVAEQTLPRIITFIVVGFLFVAVGYFSPFPAEKISRK